MLAFGLLLGGTAAANPDPPVAVTGSATDITQTSATLTGTVDPNGAATTYHFEYSTDPAFASFTKAPDPDASAGSGDDPVSVSTSVNGLQPDTTYYFRLVAANDVPEMHTGETQSFATLPRPTLVIGDTAIVEGNSGVKVAFFLVSLVHPLTGT